jgi:hypothetical protein
VDVGIDPLAKIHFLVLNLSTIDESDGGGALVRLFSWDRDRERGEGKSHGRGEKLHFDF